MISVVLIIKPSARSPMYVATGRLAPSYYRKSGLLSPRYIGDIYQKISTICWGGGENNKNEYTVPDNNPNLHIITQPVTAGADATAFVRFLDQKKLQP